MLRPSGRHCGVIGVEPPALNAWGGGVAAGTVGGMEDRPPRGHEMVLETDRLLLRPWRLFDAVVQHELWTERHARVPARRRIGADGHPTVADLEKRIRTGDPPRAVGLLAVELRGSGDVIGYCGTIENSRTSKGEPELAFELLRRTWGQGYATEAAWAVVEWARATGHPRLWATVWNWNAASRRVLAKLGFVATDSVEHNDAHGDVLFLTKRL